MDLAINWLHCILVFNYSVSQPCDWFATNWSRQTERERKGEDSTIIKSQFLSMAYSNADINSLIIFGDFIMTESPHDKHTNFVQYTYERKI